MVIFDDQLTFKEHIAKTARSCRFALHNIRKIRHFLIQHAAQLLVQALAISRLDYCNAFLAGLTSCTIKPLQMIQNASARLFFSKCKRTHVTPLFVSVHMLPVAARIKFKTLMLAYRTGSAPSYFHSLMTIYIPPEVWDLRVSDASWCHHREAQNHFPERFHSPFLAGGMNSLSVMLSPWQFSSNTWKLISSVFTWRLLKKKKKKKKKKNFALFP